MNPQVTSGLDARRGTTVLSVNVNKVALLRNSRTLDLPNLRRAATIALEAGAGGITIHPRPDERHIRAADVPELAALMKGWPQAEFNIEGNPFHNLMGFVERVRPHQCTFVPDSVEQSTSDHGWRLPADEDRLRPLIDAAHAVGVRVSLFIDPDAAAMRTAREFLSTVPGVEEVSIGHAMIADAVELGLGEAVRAYLRCIHLAHAPAPAVRA